MSEVRALYAAMLRIRMVEEHIALRYPEQEMRCPVHLSIGQEGPAAAFSLVTELHDFAVSTHRAHAHYLAKGGNLDAMIAELYGKVTGCSKGIGGSMHLADKSVNFMGSSAIVGNSIPVGVGLGLAAQIQGTGALSWVFLGDAATEEGVYYESMNFAVLKKLPVVFVCENNGFSVYSDESVRRPSGQTIVGVAESLGARAQSVDGNDAPAALATMRTMAKEVRSGGGPALIELETFRQREHCGPNFDDQLGYRSETYLQKWAARDPIDLLAGQLKSESDDAWLSKLKSEIQQEIETAFFSARAARFPTLEECREVLYG
jgi:pyruvate dehydrogenase E1 component alpha subunit